MTIEAAKKFVTKAEATIESYWEELRDYQKLYGAGKEQATKAGYKEVLEWYKSAEAVKTAYHLWVHNAVAGFGGSGDRFFQEAAALVKTVKESMDT